MLSATKSPLPGASQGGERHTQRAASGRCGLAYAVESRAQEVGEVAGVERVVTRLVAAREAGVEPLDRVATTLDVRVVRGEHRHLGPQLLDDPTRRLVRVRRRADLAPDELARKQRQVLQAFLVAPERLGRRVH